MRKFARTLFATLLLFLFPVSGYAAEEVDSATIILLIRHAEKSTVPPEDPSLNAIGKERSLKHVEIFRHAGLAAVYTSQYTRTKQTAEPLIQQLHIPVHVVDAAKSQKLVKDILEKYEGKVVLVVGHSNTLPEIIQILGAGSIPEIDDTDYENLFVVTVYEKASVLRLRFP